MPFLYKQRQICRNSLKQSLVYFPKSYFTNSSNKTIWTDLHLNFSLKDIDPCGHNDAFSSFLDLIEIDLSDQRVFI